MGNRLYYGDNLDVLRAHVGDQSVDLVYLDPPFNSNASYNILFKSPTGAGADASIEAFDDTWSWGPAASAALMDITESGNHGLHVLMQAMHTAIGENAMMAYLAMMAVRLVELHRVLKASGSLYLHCDPTASHYLKLVLDAVFGAENYVNEIIWKRTSAHSNVYKAFGGITDTIFFYAKSRERVWNQQYRAASNETEAAAFPHADADGRRWRSENMRNPGIRPNLHYSYTASNGVTYQPHPNGWTVTLEKMRQYDRDGRLHFPKNPGGRLRRKFYADETPGVKLQNLWDDIPPIGAQAQERLGYPTQKPRALLERIISPPPIRATSYSIPSAAAGRQSTQPRSWGGGGSGST